MRFKTFLAVLLLSSPAFAGSTTLAVRDGNGVLRTFDVTTDGSGNYVSQSVICDGTAAATCAVITGSGALKVDGSAVTQPVSIASLPALVAGTAVIGKVGIDQTTPGTTNLVAAGQNGTWNITNVSGTVSLPTGASTSAKQPALGTAGSASADVITMQGIASMTPILANPGTAANWGLLAIASTTSGQVGQLGMGAVTTSAPTYTTAQTDPLSLDTSGNLRVTGLTSTSYSGAITNPTSTLTRPNDTTAYAINDLIASSTTAGSIVVPSFAIANSAGGAIIPRVRVNTNVTTGWGAVNLLVTLWAVAPTYTNGDNGAYAVATGSANRIGQYQVTLTQNGDGADGEGMPNVGNASAVKLASGTAIYWDIQTLTAATPIANQTFVITPELLN